RPVEVGISPGDGFTVEAPADSPNGSAGALELLQDRAVLSVPNIRLMVVATGGNGHFAVGGIAALEDSVAVFFEDQANFFFFQIEDAAAVPEAKAAKEDFLAVRRKSQSDAISFGSQLESLLLLAVNMPQLEKAIRTTRGQGMFLWMPG